jgi:sulfite exporter TauE/SafE
MDLVSWGAGAGTALIAGLTGSGHCALMCGPLACAPVGVSPRQRRRSSWAWHAGRLAAYASVGALLGSLGDGATSLLAGPVRRYLPWLMALGLIVMALQVGKRLPPIPGVARIPCALLKWGERFSPPLRAALRGAATPFLPCGLLYGAMVIAVAAGHGAGGALVMAAFALATTPALALVQAQAARLAAVHPRARAWVQRGVPLVAAAALIWRALAAGSGAPHCH